MRGVIRLLLATLGLLGVVTSCGEPAAPTRRNVVLVCIDTLRADHVGAYGYKVRGTTPYLDRLAGRSTVFADTSATAGWTKPSVPSFLTGTMPSEHGVYEGSAHLELGAITDTLPGAARTLAEVFRDRGYRTAAFIKNAQLRPGNGFEQGFDVYRDEVGDARDVRWAGLDWIDEEAKDKPFFLYLHILDVHWPYKVPAEYAARFAPAERVEPFRAKSFREVRDAIHDGEREFTAEERADLEALYDGALRYVDDQLALFAQGLELRGLDDDTILCVISDHGEEFGEHGRIGHGHGLWEGLLRVPWILHVPGRTPERVETPVSLLDLFPTLLGILGWPADPHLLGVDRIHEPAAERPILAEHKAPDRYEGSMRRGHRKLIRRARVAESRATGSGFPVRVGQRWEAELARTPDGGLVATQLKPRDEDPDDPIELKGRMENFDGRDFTISGIAVTQREETELQLSDGVTDDQLRDGRAVKARGSFVDGVLVAERVKLYAVGEKADFELRAAVLEVRQDESGVLLRLGGHEIRVNADTEFKDVESDDGRRMSRDEVVRLLETGVDGFEVEHLLYDLLRDAGEQKPGSISPLDSFPRSLDELSRQLVEGRCFGEGDRLLLTPDALEHLQAIGYAR